MIPMSMTHKTSPIQTMPKPKNNSEIHLYPFKSTHESHQPQESIESLTTTTNPTSITCLQPDPIIRLQKIIGLGSKNGTKNIVNTQLIWSRDSQYLIYSCQAILFALHVNSADQFCFVGHADKISCMAMNSDNSILASGQAGQFSLIRLWDFNTRKCLAIFRNHDHGLHILEFSNCGGYICGVGKDKQGKTMLIIWDVRDVRKEDSLVKIVARAHTDVSISKCMFVHYDSSRLITCGRENVRFWRLKDDTLRSCAVNLSPYVQALNMGCGVDEDVEKKSGGLVVPKVFLEFTDICMNSESQVKKHIN